MIKITNKNWIQWFMGFIEAEGNFQIFKKRRINKTKNIEYYNIGYGFHLSLNIRDRELIQEIHKNLNYLGKIYEYNCKRQEVRLAVTKLEDLKWLILNIFEISPLLTKHQKERYYRFQYGVLNKFNRLENLQEYQQFLNTSYVKKLESVPLVHNTDTHMCVFNKTFDNWMSGFINGEGSFSIGRNGNLMFHIEQIESEVLYLIKIRLNLLQNIHLRKKRKENRKDTYTLTITSKKDIKALIEFFENPNIIPLQGHKAIQYLKFKNHYYSRT